MILVTIVFFANVSVAHNMQARESRFIWELFFGTPAAIIDNPYQEVSALVQKRSGLSDKELLYLAKRLPKTRDALAQFLERDLYHKRPFRIAFCGSGGGYRAMLCMTGWLSGAEKIGLLNSVTYYAGVSGATWLAPWFTQGGSIAHYKEQLKTKLSSKLGDLSYHEIKLMLETFIVKRSSDQPLSLVDLYGAYLANRLLLNFGEMRHRVHLSDQIPFIENGDMMFPVYTAVLGNYGWCSDREVVKWFEYTPYEVGSDWLGMYVPSWAYGRKFNNGVSIDNSPEQSLGFLMGTWGSAFAANAEVAYEEGLKDLFQKIPGADTVMSSILNCNFFGGEVGETRLSSGEINNFMHGFISSPLHDEEELDMVDAGLGFNLPYPPMMRSDRAVDLLIFLDASDRVDEGQNLHLVENHARMHNSPFPTIDYTDIGKRAISVFKENNLDVPVVIYMPRVKDEQLWEQCKEKSRFCFLYGLH